MQHPNFDKLFEYGNKKDNYLEIQIRDTGIGIKQKKIKSLFQLFGQTNQSSVISAKGIGLGLSVTKRILNMLDGDIICQSQLGKGSNFVFVLPFEVERADVRSTELSSRIRNPKQKKYEKFSINV